MKVMRILAGLLLAVGASNAGATMITFDATNLGGAAWRYDYSITNDTQAGGIDYFTISFDQALYSDLRGAAGPEGWDILLLQPDPGIPADGVFDSLALGPGIAFGTTLAGFSVTVDFLGSVLPATLPFLVMNPFTFEPVEEGVASLPASSPPAAVPEPSTQILLASAILMAIVSVRRRRLAVKRA